MTDSTFGDSTTKIQSQKPCCLNWEYQEVVTLIVTKRDEFLVRLYQVHLQDLFKIVVVKWQKIVNVINKAGHFPILCNKP